jgi:tetratricopeptide (TPR) repeat protein
VAPKSAGLEHRFELVRLYELMTKPELAEAELREMLSRGLDRAGDPKVELELIAFLKRTNQIEKAQAFVNELIAQNPRQPLWLHELGKLLIEREEYSAAVSPLRTAAELTAYQAPEMLKEWLQALVQARREREAVSVYESLPPNSLTPTVKTYGAEAFLAQDRRDIALLLLEQALGEASLEGVHAVRAVPLRAETLLGREETLGLLRRAVDSATGADAKSALQLSLAEFLAGDSDPAKRAAALPEVDAVLSRVTPGTVLHLETLLTRALVLDLAGDAEQAVAVYEQALELRETDIRALNNLAYLLADKMERPTEALLYARRLQEVAPADNVTTLDTVGWVYFKNGDIARALPVFLEAARIDPEHLAIRYHLGLVYADGGRRADAERELRRVLELAQEQQNAEYAGKAQEALEKLR